MTTAFAVGWVLATSLPDAIAQIVVGVAVVAILAMLGFTLKAALWLAGQMKSNGEAKKAGTANANFRETLDRIKGDLDDNTADTRALTRLTDNVRRQVEVRTEQLEERTEERHQENVAALADMTDGFKSHLAWSDNVVIELRAMIAELAIRVTALEHLDSRPPRLESGDDE